MTTGYDVKPAAARKTRGVLYLRNLPEVVKLKFKAAIALRGLTMEGVIAEMMKKFVDDPGCVRRWAKKRTKKKEKAA